MYDKVCKFQPGDKARVIAVDVEDDGGGEITFKGRVGEVVMVQASNEDKPEGPTGPWMVDLKFDDDDSDMYYFDESELALVLAEGDKVVSKNYPELGVMTVGYVEPFEDSHTGDQIVTVYGDHESLPDDADLSDLRIHRS